ncbi:hypothetical protein EV368DRAFT_66188 [Lentinula lateritia]|nr:hypothetical protein EV368DRAFT_66188 [Lentinula lateritia]
MNSLDLIEIHSLLILLTTKWQVFLLDLPLLRIDALRRRRGGETIELIQREMVTGETETEIMIEEEGRHLDGMIGIEREINGDHRRQGTGILVENEEDCVDHHRGRLQGHPQDRLTTEIETGIRQEIVTGLPRGIGFRLIHHRIEASRDSRYRHSRAPSRDQRRHSPDLPAERRPLRDPDSPRDEGEIREYDTPDRDKPSSQNQRAPSLARETPSTLPVPEEPEEPKTSLSSAKAVPPPTLAKNIVENDVKPNVIPADAPASTALPPSSLPPAPQVLPQQSIRSTSPPKHPRNWSESRPTESSLFIPPSIRRGRGRGSGSPYRGGTYRGGGPPDAPRAPRNRGPSQQSTGPDNSEETTVAPSGVNVPSPADTSNPKAETPPIHPSVEPEESIEQLLKWVNEELIVTDIMQEERRIMDRSKVLRDEYLAAHQYTHQLMMDHYKITNEAHRALHEYEMVNQELKHLQLRRQVLNKQQELARLGLLGMDYEPDGNSISTPGR